MKSNEYQELAAQTLIDGPDQPLTAEELAMFSTMLQFHSRIGQLTEKLKKQVLHRHGPYAWDDFAEDLGQMRDDLQRIRSTSPVNELSDANTMALWNVIGLLGESSEVAEQLRDNKSLAEADRQALFTEGARDFLVGLEVSEVKPLGAAMEQMTRDLGGKIRVEEG